MKIKMLSPAHQVAGPDYGCNIGIRCQIPRFIKIKIVGNTYKMNGLHIGLGLPPPLKGGATRL